MTTKSTRNVRRLPWVTRLPSEKHYRCSAVKSGQPLRAYRTGQAQACNKRAWWHFTALMGSNAHSGYYCWMHLVYSGLNGDTRETERTDRWYATHGYVS